MKGKKIIRGMKESEKAKKGSKKSDIFTVSNVYAVNILLSCGNGAMQTGRYQQLSIFWSILLSSSYCHRPIGRSDALTATQIKD
jgi:hypothetical protein